jgi:hypothetical protein
VPPRLIYGVLAGHSSDYTVNGEKLPDRIDCLCTYAYHAYESVHRQYKDNIGKNI